LSKNK